MSAIREIEREHYKRGYEDALKEIDMLAVARKEIENNEWTDMDVHYVCCQLIATFCTVREVTHEEAWNIVEQIKDEIDEMDYHWIGSEDSCNGERDCDGCGDEACDA